MDVMTAILTRRSEQRLDAPAPGDAEFTYLLQGAVTAPDHGRLRPWRWVLLRGEDREVLGDCLAADAADLPGDQVRAKLLRAPLVALLVLSPRESGRIPEWEQLAAASCMTHALMLLLHSRGYGSIWRTGRLARSTAVADLLGLQPHERLLGSLDIGSPILAAPRERRPLDDVTGLITRFDAVRTAAPAGAAA